MKPPLYFYDRESKNMINTYEMYLDHPAGNILKVEDALDIYILLYWV